MSEVNRCVAIARVKQPFMDWLKSLPDPTYLTIEEVNIDNTAYLLPEYEETNQSLNILEYYYELIFDEQLWSWWTNEKDWPKNRDFATFLKWFDVKMNFMVIDLVDEPIKIYDESRHKKCYFCRLSSFSPV